MPKLSTSPRVRARIRILLKKILEHADLGLSAQMYSAQTSESEIFEYRWIDELSARPKLLVKTKLCFLADLIASESAVPVSKDHVREVLLVLQKKLDILEDNRLKTRGSDVWEFTLKLWDTAIDRNLSRFDQVWEHYKSTHGNGSPGLTPTLSHKLIQTASRQNAAPLHNLTLRPDSYFIDTQAILSELFATLSDAYADAVVSIVGPGGIGKTTLALEVAYRCLAAVQEKLSQLTAPVPVFEVIVFASAQPQEFLGPHLSERWQTDRTLKDIIREILRTVDYAEGMPFELNEQIEFVHSVLKSYKTLLILDNLETTENPQRLLAFVRSLPQSVKVILTSRTRFGLGKTISLDYLPAEPSLSFIEHQARKKLVALQPTQAQEIYRLSGGLPLAMSYSIGHLAVYSKLPKLGKNSSAQQPSEMARYCVEASLKQLNNKSAYQLLLASTLFTGKFSAQAAAHIAGLPQDTSGKSQEFSSLYRLSLINKLDSTYYSLHSITQEFVRPKFDEITDFKETAQQRWIEWYLDILDPLADDWLDWQDYSEVDIEWSNIRSLLNWCIEQRKYSDFLALWRGLRGYTLLRGYWDERQRWMNELIDMASGKFNNHVLTLAMFYKGQTLVHLDETGKDGRALRLLEKVWNAEAEVDSEIKFGALTYLAALSLKQNKFDQAMDWLKKGETVTNCSQLERSKQHCVFFYYVGEIALRQERYEDAEKAYRNSLEFSEATKWKKMTSYAKAWLATTLLRKGNLDDAEPLMLSALDAATFYKDNRSIANCYYNLALLGEQRNQHNAFKEWTQLAKKEFEKLGMLEAENQMKQWLKENHSNKRLN